jgi:hypothetical protein
MRQIDQRIMKPFQNLWARVVRVIHRLILLYHSLKESLQFARMEDGLEPPPTRAIRRWIRFEGREDFCRLVKEVEGDVDCGSPTKDQLERFGLSLP